MLIRCSILWLICIISFRGSSQGIQGIYLGEVNGDPTTVTLKVVGKQVTGTYTESANSFEVKGQIMRDNSFDGTLILSQTGEQLGTFKARVEQNTLYMDILLLGVTSLSVSFTRKSELEAKNLIDDKVGLKPTVQPLKAANDGLERDPAVFGKWTKQEVMNSGLGDNAASLAMIYFLSLNPDGSFIQEKASAGGGSAWSSVTNRELDVSGHWYTKELVMYVRPLGQSQYQRLYPYLFHQGALVFKTEQNKYMIWNRSNE